MRLFRGKNQYWSVLSFSLFSKFTMMSLKFSKFNFAHLLIPVFQYALFCTCKPDPGLNPVILFPGIGGWRLEVRAEKAYSCKDQKSMGKYDALWINLGYFLPSSFNCFKDRFELVYSKDSDYPQPREGIHVRVPHFGKTESVEYLNSFLRFGPV